MNAESGSGRSATLICYELTVFLVFIGIYSMCNLKFNFYRQVLAISGVLLLMHGTASATAPRSSYTTDIVTSPNTEVSTESIAWTSTARLRDSSPIKYDSSFIRDENRDWSTGLTNDSTNSNQTDGSLTIPESEDGKKADTYFGSMRDLWAGSNGGDLVHLAEFSITQSGTGVALITTNAPLPGAVWLGLIGLSAIGITRSRKESA